MLLCHSIPNKTKEIKQHEKSEQIWHNKYVERAFNGACQEYDTPYSTIVDAYPLRSCQAEVIETTHYYILRSYRTKIACINKDSKVCFDALRLVYGYTSTSAHHISKFKQDYGATSTVTWRYI